MGKILVVISLIVLFFLSNAIVCDSANSSTEGTGAELFAKCQEALNFFNTYPQGYTPGSAECLGMVGGVIWSIRSYENAFNVGGVCIPEAGVSNYQAIMIVMKYLKEHPKYMHYSMYYLVWESMLDAFPCVNPK